MAEREGLVTVGRGKLRTCSECVQVEDTLPKAKPHRITPVARDKSLSLQTSGM